ncbi:FecR domain-containing protein [Lentisphaera profundi]|uniref:FecR domain-containing protein n=1 Tax=Lentisphaera profundi TaxID=1658616 RepID=A0ABY7VNK3_9BACT|nr:LamG-like jellyroll fold domain-containing protein [Lentisphaera profundi]WDE95341.1 FecR domain-containing protein [Lentisphaera profundi]
MKDLELLIDKCLHGEANEEDKNELKKLIDESDEAFEFYLESLEQQSELKEWAQNQKPEKNKVKSFQFYKYALAVAALFVLAFVLFTPIVNKPNLVLSIHSVSTNYKLIRNGEMIENANRIKKGDQILVGLGGQVRIDIAQQDSQIHLMENSSVNFVNRDCNYINLQQGEIRAKLEKQKVPFIIKTNEGEAEIIGTEFSLSDKGETQLWVSSGKVKLNRGAKDSVFVGAGQRIDTELFKLEEKRGSHIIPEIHQGVEYFYYANPSETLTLDADMDLLSNGIRNDFSYLTGAYDGYVRASHTAHSYVSHKPFLMVLKSYYKSELTGPQIFRVSSLRATNLRINEKLYKLNENGEISVDLKKGLNLIELRTIGGLEKDTGETLVNIQKQDDKNPYASLSMENLFYTSSEALADLTDLELQEALTCDLPLSGDFLDKSTGLEAEVFGEPQFVMDDEMGTVMELNSSNTKDYLVHTRADELGLNGSYTVTCRIYFNELMRSNTHDDAIFSTEFKAPVEGNSTLVLLIRRAHPYLAHLANDSISSVVMQEKKWYDLAFRFDRNTQSIFVDGDLVMSSNKHSKLYSKEKLQIGRWTRNFLKGRICDIRIYNRALSLNNIAHLYD